MRRVAARWRSRARRIGEEWATWRAEWALERELERVVAGDGPILAGPWCSEVGYEVLYWIPFLRWVAAAYRVPPERIIAMSRGGTASWYDGVAAGYVEIFQHMTPAELRTRTGGRPMKQRTTSELDQELIERASLSGGLPSPVSVLHPSLMFGWFAPFWSGHEGMGYLDRHTRYMRHRAPDVHLPVALPADYAVMKLYRAHALPDTPAVLRQLHALVDALADRMPVVLMDTGLGVDDHVDYSVAGGARVVSLDGRLDASTNLAVQARIAAGARLYVGTCGSLAWLAPLLGVPTIPLFSDASFLHAHLHVARRVYGRVHAASFSPIDLSGLVDVSLSIAAVDPAAAGAGLP